MVTRQINFDKDKNFSCVLAGLWALEDVEFQTIEPLTSLGQSSVT
jgi:hypothetical protein